MTSGSILKKDQIYHQLRDAITAGKLATGSKLSRETDLATELGVSRITLRASLNRLEQEGFIKRVQGRGTFVASQTKHPTTNGTIMVIHATDSGFESSWHYMVPEISRLAHDHQLKTFVTTTTAFELFADDDITSFITNKNVVGIIATINNFNGDETILKKLQATTVPVILAHAKAKDPAITGFAAISLDEKAGWQVAIKHLAEQGHTNIAVIGSDGSSPFRDNTIKETIKLLTNCGAKPNPDLIRQVHFDKTAISTAVKELLKVSPAPTAFLCYSDFYAVYVYDVLAKLKQRIPEDIAVMGICGFPDAKLLSAPLSTIDYGYAEFAKMAVEMVIEPKKWFDAKTGKGKLRMKPFTLKARKSTEQ
jgi:GntR family transcriptional regulator, arabinose operon transcriptional repressor